MLHINEIELFDSPRKNILPLLGDLQGEPEMSVEESAFLCGLIKKYTPRKIVEVGIAGGGTTAIILECIKELNLKNVEMHSIDIEEYFYRNNNLKSGFLGTRAKDITKYNVNHTFHYGKVACAYNDILENTDFLILDTTHSMPGELLDFLTLLPVLKDGAVVVLHDISYSHISEFDIWCDKTATSNLFATVVAEKYINYLNKNNYANIGAFIIDDNTKKYISNVFLSLMINWSYWLDENQVLEYRKCIANNYDNNLLNLFNSAIKYNNDSINIKRISIYKDEQKIEKMKRLNLYLMERNLKLRKEMNNLNR